MKTTRLIIQNCCASIHPSSFSSGANITIAIERVESVVSRIKVFLNVEKIDGLGLWKTLLVYHFKVKKLR